MGKIFADLIKKPLEKIAENDFLWRIFRATVINASHYAIQKRQYHESNMENILKSAFPEGEVLNGPFKGLKYPEFKSFGSTLYPKLLGSYEQELHSVVSRILKKEYAAIVDIGSAEGYYAVGLAVKLPEVKVYAFDINNDALDQVSKMAEANGVANRVSTGKSCTIDSIKEIISKNEGKILFISDCEGYEKHLFNEESKDLFANHELLIEVHDLIDLEISSILKSAFKDTHEIEIIESIPDIQKPFKYEYAELNGIDINTKKRLLAESRATQMEWFYFSPKTK